MKELFYSLFALLFKLSRIFPVKENRICFVSMHNEGFHDSLGAVKQELEKRGGTDLRFLNKNDLDFHQPKKAIAFFLTGARALATSRVVFLNDNFLPMSKLRFSEKTTVVQLWHAEGAFKKFGLSIPQEETLRKNELAANRRVDYVVCTSKALVPIYAEAFGVAEQRVLPLGSARTDLIFNAPDTQALKAEFIRQHPECEGKRIVLYAPTFRDDAEKDKQILSHFDIDALEKQTGGKYVFFVRLHPQIHAGTEGIKQGRDLTSYPDATKLMLISDVLITDYSSICMDFVLLGKPVLFYAFDLPYYDAARSFYFDYESYVPGKVVKDEKALCEALNGDFDFSRAEKFRRFNFDHFDGKAAERIADRFVK